MIKKIIHFIKNQKHYLSSDRYIAFLRSKGITIGENCIIRFPRSTFIDLTSLTSYLNRKQGRYEHQFQNIYS